MYNGRLSFYYGGKLIEPKDIDIYVKNVGGTEKYYYSFQINNRSYLLDSEYIKNNADKLRRDNEKDSYNIDTAVNIEKRHPDYNKTRKDSEKKNKEYDYTNYATFFIVDYGYDKDGNLKSTCSYIDCTKRAGGAWENKDGSYFFREASETEQDKISDSLGFDDNNLSAAAEEKENQRFTLDDLRVKAEASQTRFKTGPVDIDAEHEYLEELEELSGRSNILDN